VFYLVKKKYYESVSVWMKCIVWLQRFCCYYYWDEWRLTGAARCLNTKSMILNLFPFLLSPQTHPVAKLNNQTQNHDNSYKLNPH